MDKEWRSSVLSIMAVEVLAFIAAACIHVGFFAPAYEEHPSAAAVEIILGMVLLLGLIGAVALPGIARILSLATQGVALLGSLIEILVVVLGASTRTAPGMVYQIMLVVLVTTGFRRAAGAPWRPFRPTT